MSSASVATGHPVDVATGILFTRIPEVDIEGRVNLFWNRFYSTGLLALSATSLGPGWTNPYFSSLRWGNGRYEITTPDGDIQFLDDPQGLLQQGQALRNLGGFQELTREDDRYVLTRWNVETGDVERYVYADHRPSGEWLLSAYEDLTGEGLDILRDESGRLLAIRQRREKRRLLVDYNSAGLIQSVTLEAPNGHRSELVQYDYDGRGRLVAATDAAGHSDCYRYDEAGRLVEERRKDGGIFRFRFDNEGRCVHTVGVNGYDEKTLRFLPQIGWTEVTDSLGHVARYQWSRNGQVVQQIDPTGAITQRVYDEDGRIVSLIDGNGAATQFAYDERGNRVRSIDPLNQAYVVEFNEWHQATSITDPAQGVWQRKFDRDHRVREVITPVGGCWQFDYEDGLPVRVINPAGAARTLRYSKFGTLEEATDWEGRATQYATDDFGRVIRRTGPAGEVTEFAYDALGQVVRVTLDDGATVRCAYDAGGNMRRVRNAAGGETSYKYGPCGRLLEKIDPLGHATAYHWSTEPGRLEGIVNARGEQYTIVYDPAGRKVWEQSFEGRVREFAYDPGGYCKWIRNERGEEIRLRRDAVGRIIARELPDGSQTEYQYDHAGNLLAAKSADCELKYELDPLGRVVKEVQDGFAVERRYDPMGNVLGIATSLGHRVQYAYDSNGTVARITVRNGPSVSVQRSANGGTVQWQLTDQLRWIEQFDRLGRLSQQQLEKAGALGDATGEAAPTGRGPLRRSYRYSLSGGLTTLQCGRRGTTDYEYNAADQLLSAKQGAGQFESYRYDSTGNLLSIQRPDSGLTLEYGPGDRLARTDTATYAYDDSGRLVRKTEHTATGVRTWQYEWNYEDRLTGVTTPDGETWTYRYDPLGRRVSKQGSAGETRFVWDGDVILHQITEAGTTTWTYDDESYSPLIAQRNGRVSFLLDEQLGAVTECVDEHGALLWAGSYGPWGTVAPADIAREQCPFRFPGHWHDAETGLHYSRYRFYDPQVGRFLSPDPIGLLAGTNAYRYAPNPVMWLDPLGLEIMNVNPNNLNFSQRSVTCNGPRGSNTYQQAMQSGDWDWNRSGPLRVMEVDGQMVSYDNRRLRAAQRSGSDSVPIEVVHPDDIMPGSKKTWRQAFNERRNDPRNVARGGSVPEGGVREQPECAG